MSNLHKSKEIYKAFRDNGDQTLVPIRGLYVSGTHREPWYIDHAITISDFNSTDGDIVNYTVMETEQYEHSCIALQAFSLSDISYTNYTSTYVDQYEDSVLGISSISMSSIDYTSYTTLNVNQYEDSVLGIVDIDMGGLEYTTYRRKQNQQPGQHCISIVSWNVTDGNIS